MSDNRLGSMVESTFKCIKLAPNDSWIFGDRSHNRSIQNPQIHQTMKNPLRDSLPCSEPSTSKNMNELGKLETLKHKELIAGRSGLVSNTPIPPSHSPSKLSILIK